MALALRDHIEKLMKDHGDLTVSDLARLANIPQPTLHHILTGATKRPRKKLIRILAEFFGVGMEELINGKFISVSDNYAVPIINWNELNYLNNLNNSSIQIDSRKKVFTEVKLSSESFALECEDDLMEPMFPRGCILIFDPAREAKDRNFVIVYIEKNQTYLFNRIFVEDDLYYIKSSDDNNSKISLNKLSPKDKIIATLVESKVRF